MSKTAKPEVFYPRNTIAEKVGIAPSIRLDELLDSAEQAVDEIAPEAIEIMKGEAARLRKACGNVPDGSGLQAAQRKEILEAADALRELAGSFAYPLVSDIANSLYVLVSRSSGSDARARSVIDLHVDAIEAVLREDLKDDGGAVGEAMVASLRKAVYTFASGG
jgi:hypothetical protein